MLFADPPICLTEVSMNLHEFFTDHPRVAIAFSGGVDSAYLLYAAKQYAKDVCAYYVKSAFQPQFELNDALHIATDLGVKMEIIELNILACKLRLNGISVPHARNGYSIFSGTKYY